MREIPRQTKEEFAELYVDIFQLLYLPEDLRVNDRLREFLVHMVVMYSEGWELDNSEGVKEIAKRMNFRNRDEVYNYKARLKKKGLMLQTANETILPQALRVAKIPRNMVFKFKVVNTFIKDQVHNEG